MHSPSRRATVHLALLLLVPRVLAAQYPLAPTPVLNTATIAPEPRLSGFVTMRETLRDDSATFALRHARIGVVARPVSFAALRLQADLAAPGRATNDTVAAFSFTDAYVQLFLTDTFPQIVRVTKPALLVGQFKAPFSLESMTSSSAVITANRSLAVDRLGVRRELGVQAHLSLSRFGTLAGAVLNGEGANRIGNPDSKQMVTGRLTLFPIDGVAIAGKWLSHGSDHRWGYDARVIVNDELIIEGEAIKRQGPSNATTEIDAGGGYALVAYRLVPWFQPIVKWERLRELTVTATTTAERDLTWMTYGFQLLAPRDRARFQLNWIAKSGDPFNGENELIAQLQVIY